MGLFSSIIKSVTKAVSSVYKVVDNGINYVFKKADQMISSIENASLNIIKGLARETLSVFRFISNPVTSLSSDIVRTITKQFNLQGLFSNYKKYKAIKDIIVLPKFIDLGEQRKFNQLNRRKQLEEQVYPLLVNSNHIKFDVKRLNLDNSPSQIIKPIGELIERTRNIEVRSGYLDYENDWVQSTIMSANNNFFHGYEIGKDIMFEYRLVNLGDTTNPNYHLYWTITKSVIDELPVKLDGEWYAVFDPKYFIYSRRTDGVWYEYPQCVTRGENFVTVDIYMSGAGLKTGQWCRFESREARYIKEVM